MSGHRCSGQCPYRAFGEGQLQVLFSASGLPSSYFCHRTLPRLSINIGHNKSERTVTEQNLIFITHSFIHSFIHSFFIGSLYYYTESPWYKQENMKSEKAQRPSPPSAPSSYPWSSPLFPAQFLLLPFLSIITPSFLFSTGHGPVQILKHREVWPSLWSSRVQCRGDHRGVTRPR
jgi:hypothetical protein